MEHYCMNPTLNKDYVTLAWETPKVITLTTSRTNSKDPGIPNESGGVPDGVPAYGIS